MNDAELDQKLRTAQGPALDAEYLADFPRQGSLACVPRQGRRGWPDLHGGLGWVGGRRRPRA